MQSEEYKKWAKGEADEDMEEEYLGDMVEESEDQEYLVVVEAVDIARN